MKLWIFWIVGLAIALPHLNAGDLEGTWEGTLAIGNEQVYAGFDLDLVGDQITGTAFIQGWNQTNINGTSEGDRFRFVVNRTAGYNQPTSKVELRGQVVGKLMTLSIVDEPSRETTLHRVESQITDAITVGASPKELEGKWVARFVGRIGNRPKMIGQIVLDLRVEGSGLTGVAHTVAWPCDCSISEGKVESGRFSFNATGARPSSSGIPVLSFKGEIHGNRMKLTMRHQMFGGDNGVDIPMDATRM
jgi:hypothetical protein